MELTKKQFRIVWIEIERGKQGMELTKKQFRIDWIEFKGEQETNWIEFERGNKRQNQIEKT